MQPVTLTMEHIHARCTPVGECLIWNDAVTRPRHPRTGEVMPGYPIIKNGPRGCLLARREVARLAGHELAPRQPVETTCGHRLCLNPAHLALSTIAAIASKAAARGAFSTVERGRAIAAAKRAAPDAKLTLEKARAIRASNESGPVLAKRHNVNRSLIGAIRRGEAWPEHDDANAYHIHQLVRLRRQIGSAAHRLQRTAEKGARA